MIRLKFKDNASANFRAFQSQFMGVVGSSVEEIRDTIAVRATTEYMREFDPSEVIRPASSDTNLPLIKRFNPVNPTPILRRLTGRLTASILGNQGGLRPAFLAGGGFMSAASVRDETIHDLTVNDSEVRLRFGSSTPYAAIHEYGGTANGKRISKRPYLRPALNDVAPIAPFIVEQRLIELASRLELT